MLDFTKSPLVPVVVQDEISGAIRMVAFANELAVRRTLETGLATFFSRSRGELWEKGRTSGHTLQVSEVLVDCDADALVYLAKPTGPTCHTGAPSCFFRRLTLDPGTGAFVLHEVADGAPGEGAPTMLAKLEGVLEARKTDVADKSYTKSLYDGGPGKIGEKLREEAGELAVAVAEEDDARVVDEAADLLFHALVALRSRDVDVRDVLAELARRMGTSGHEEKRRRGH